MFFRFFQCRERMVTFGRHFALIERRDTLPPRDGALSARAGARFFIHAVYHFSFPYEKRIIALNPERQSIADVALAGCRHRKGEHVAAAADRNDGSIVAEKASFQHGAVLAMIRSGRVTLCES